MAVSPGRVLYLRPRLLCDYLQIGYIVYFVKYKAGLVVKNDLHPSICHNFCTIPFVLRTSRSLLAIVALYDLEIIQCDALWLSRKSRSAA